MSQSEAALQATPSRSDLGELRNISDVALQQLLADAVRIYAQRVESGCRLAPFPPGSDITATEVMIAGTGMLKAVNLQLFELGMWQASTGNF